MLTCLNFILSYFGSDNRTFSVQQTIAEMRIEVFLGFTLNIHLRQTYFNVTEVRYDGGISNNYLIITPITIILYV